MPSQHRQQALEHIHEFSAHFVAFFLNRAFYKYELSTVFLMQMNNNYGSV